MRKWHLGGRSGVRLIIVTVSHRSNPGGVRRRALVTAPAFPAGKIGAHQPVGFLRAAQAHGNATREVTPSPKR